MEAIVEQCDILNLSSYQLQIKIPPSHSTVVPKFIRMWTIDSSLVKYSDILNLSSYQLQIDNDVDNI